MHIYTHAHVHTHAYTNTHKQSDYNNHHAMPTHKEYSAVYTVPAALLLKGTPLHTHREVGGSWNQDTLYWVYMDKQQRAFPGNLTVELPDLDFLPFMWDPIQIVACSRTTTDAGLAPLVWVAGQVCRQHWNRQYPLHQWIFGKLKFFHSQCHYTPPTVMVWTDPQVADMHRQASPEPQPLTNCV